MESDRTHDQLVASLVEIFTQHRGRGNGISARDLAAQLAVPPRTVRNLITEQRLLGFAICGHPATGYFVAMNDQELAETCEFLRQRALHSLRLLSVMSGQSMAELLGQLRLPT